MVAQLQLDDLNGVTQRTHVDVQAAGISAVLRRPGDDAASPALAHHPGLVGGTGDGGNAFIRGSPSHVVVGRVLGFQHGVQRPIVVHAHPRVRLVEVHARHRDDHPNHRRGLTAGAVRRGGCNGGLARGQRRDHAVFVHGNLLQIVGLVRHRLIAGILRADRNGQLRRLPQDHVVFLLLKGHGLGQPNHLHVDGARYLRHLGAGGGDGDRSGLNALHAALPVHRGDALVRRAPRQFLVVGVLGEHSGLYGRRFAFGQRGLGQFQLNFFRRLTHLYGHAGLDIAVLGLHPDGGAAPAHARDHAVFIHRGHLGLAAFVGHALQGRVFRA